MLLILEIGASSAGVKCNLYNLSGFRAKVHPFLAV